MSMCVQSESSCNLEFKKKTVFIYSGCVFCNHAMFKKCCDFFRNDILRCITFQVGTVVAQWLRCCATNWKVAGSIPAGVIGFFIDIKSVRSHYGPGVDSASNRDEYQKHLLG